MQPEEFVRQLLLVWFIKDAGYRPGRIQVEKSFNLYEKLCRFDIVVYDQQVKPWLLVECKAPDVPVHQDVFNQIAAYNLALGAPYLLVTNGRLTLCARIDVANKTWIFLPELPIHPDSIAL